MTRPSTRVQRLGDAFERAGVTVSDVDPLLVKRMQLLFEHTETVSDCTRAVDLAELVFERYADRGTPFTQVEQATVRVGSLFSDIGKTGPLHASPDQQRLIVDMFSIECVPNDKMAVEDFFDTYFTLDAAARIACFETLGLDRRMPMRDFWNLHVGWTLELLNGRASFPEFVPAAASHHLLEHINPGFLVAEDGSFTKPFGSNTQFDRAEKLVVVLDKYDAARRRSGLDHGAAMSWLRQLVHKSPRFAQDEEFAELLVAVDEVARN